MQDSYPTRTALAENPSQRAADFQARSSDRSPKVSSATLPVSVIVPVRNEAKNLARCLESLRSCGEVFVVDSQSSDTTAQIAADYSAELVQFRYGGGWPKKRQWAMNTIPLSYEWTLLLDADESLTPALIEEIRRAIQVTAISGYYLGLEMHFLGRLLRHSGARFSKLSLFRTGKGRFECRLREQDISMCDMEVHEHVVVDGPTAELRSPLVHRNEESLSRYIAKHNEYSTWEAKVWMEGQDSDDLPASLWGNQAQRRRWLRKRLFSIPGSPLAFFLYKYFFCLGFLDGIPGLVYCAFQGIQFFTIKAKIYERRLSGD